MLCTSGTAATHFHGAVAESDLSNVPMIVCTADRPPELRDVGAPQTINQTNLFGTAVRWFHDPGVPADDASHSWRSLASRALSAACGLRPGPVHLNLPFREPLLDEPGEPMPVRDEHWTTTHSVLGVDDSAVANVARLASGRRGLIVAGRGSTPAVLTLGEKLGWPVLAEPRSGVRINHPNVVAGFDPVLRSSQFAQNHRPDVVIRIGESVASKVTNQWISASGAVLVQIRDSEIVFDPDHSVHTMVAAPVDGFVVAVAAEVHRTDASWLAAWQSADAAAQSAIDAWTGEHHSEATVSRLLSKHARAGVNIVVSSSMPVRDFEWFGGRLDGVAVYSNRGANGIDGVVSTAVGVALGTDQPTYVLIGDVAMVHDSNGLWGISPRGIDMNIVVNNNDGGSIFSFLPQAGLVNEETFELLYGTPHGVDFGNLCAAHGVQHTRVTDSRELEAHLGIKGVSMTEVVFDRSVNVAQHDQLNAAVVAAVNSAVS